MCEYVVAFTWAVALLTYLMPPCLYEQIITLTVPWKQSLFIGVATLVFTVDFVMARHLFCRYGCAVGLFQSLLWMMNTKAIVVSFDHQRANLCKGCDKDCEDACPMRLSVRGYKRAKFTCTQCAQCISACQHVQRGNPEGSLLNWTPGEQIKQVSLIPLKDVTSVKPKPSKPVTVKTSTTAKTLSKVNRVSRHHRQTGRRDEWKNG